MGVLSLLRPRSCSRCLALAGSSAFVFLVTAAGCSSFGTDPASASEAGNGSDGTGPDAATNALDATTLDGPPGLPDGAIGPPDGSACETTLLDDFEGAWTKSKWSFDFKSGQGTIAVDSRRKLGLQSLRFQTQSFSDRAYLRKEFPVPGTCTFTFASWIYVANGSRMDGAGIFRIVVGNNEGLFVGLQEGGTVVANAMSTSIVVGLDQWILVTVVIDPATGKGSLGIGAAKSTFELVAGAPTALEIGVLGASDGGGNEGDEILFDDVRVLR